MAHSNHSASVDYLVDENASRIDIRNGSEVRATGDVDEAIGATSPANWWLSGLIALSIVVVILIGLQLFGGRPGTDVQPGTPVAVPETVLPQ